MGHQAFLGSWQNAQTDLHVRPEYVLSRYLDVRADLI